MVDDLIVNIGAYVILKCYGIKKWLIMSLSYNLIVYLFNVVLKAVYIVNYESTIIGIIVINSSYLYNNYINPIRKLVYYLYTLPRDILSFFIPVLPEVIISNLCLQPHTSGSLFVFFVSLIYNITIDFILRYCK